MGKASKVTMRGFAKQYLLPPATWKLLTSTRTKLAGTKDTKGKGGTLQHWNGEEMAAHQEAWRFPADGSNGPFAVTIGIETRVARKLGKGMKVRPPKTESGVRYMQLGLAAAEGASVRNVSILLDGRPAAKLHGSLPGSRWTDVRVETDGMNCDVSLAFEGTGEVWCSRPVVGRKRSSPERRSIVIIIADSLRPDDLGLTAPRGRRGRTPFIDGFFGDGLVFRNAYSQAEWTLPALASIMSGTYAVQHGVYVPYEGGRALPPIETMPEVFSRNGYHTYCSSGARRFTPAYGHYRGADRFRFATPAGKGPYCEEEVLHAIEFMEAHKEEAFFCFLHFLDPHEPFARASYYSDVRAPSETWSSVHELVADYRAKAARSDQADNPESPAHADILNSLRDAMISKLDLRLSSLFSYLEKSGLLDTTTVMLTSDHGREDAPGFHSPSLDPSRPPLLTRKRVGVPLVIRDKRHAGGEVASFVECGIDLMPTALGAANLKIPEHVCGVDILSGGTIARECVYSESLFRGVYELTIRDTEWCYFVRTAMDEATGNVVWDDRIDERLFAAPEDDYTPSGNRIADEQSVARKFRSLAKAHINRPRYFS